MIAIMRENYSGKSTLAKAIQKTTGAEIVTGKDDLRMAKSESEAAHGFRRCFRDLWHDQSEKRMKISA